MSRLTRERILELLEALDRELTADDVTGELYLVGGAVMCLVFQARPATRDVDAYFQPAAVLRAAAKRVAKAEALEDDWLNDAVKGYLSETAQFATFLERDHLRVFVARPEYLLAMKCLAMRLGPEFHDEADVRYLLRHLGISSYHEAVEVITAYYPLDRFPQKTLYALEEIIEDMPPMP